MVIFFSILMIAVAVAATVFWVWMLIDCAMQEPSEGNDKVVWVLIILFANVIGALVYYFVRRPQRRSAFGH